MLEGNIGIVAPERESIQETEKSLSSMMSRLQKLIEQPALNENDLVEINVIFNNVSYVFLYLEAHDEHVKYDHLLYWRDQFFQNPLLDDKILKKLELLRCDDKSAESSRLAYIKQLVQKKHIPDPVFTNEMQELKLEANNILQKKYQEQSDFLNRLGVPATPKNASALYLKLTARCESPETRKKLYQKWNQIRSVHGINLVSTIDKMVNVRRTQASQAGYSSVLQRTLENTQLKEKEIEEFLNTFMKNAVEQNEKIALEMEALLGPNTTLAEDFSYYLRTLTVEKTVPLFQLELCLEFISSVVLHTFGIKLVREETVSGKSHLTMIAWKEDQELGTIYFDLWDTEAKARAGGANFTLSIRNRTNWGTFVQRPVAHVSCRFQTDRNGVGLITFQNIHSLFHEVGHAVNHLLIKKRISNQAGLEYLPIERLEQFSMWFEKWAYHPDFGPQMGLSPSEQEGLELCRKMKIIEYRRTYVERAVSAMLDFGVHRSNHLSFTEVYEDLDQRFGISRFCTLSEIAPLFTWPMYLAYPGSNFAYVWGSADSCEKFLPFISKAIKELPPSSVFYDLFTTCLDYDLPSKSPNPMEIFRFYERVSVK